MSRSVLPVAALVVLLLQVPGPVAAAPPIDPEMEKVAAVNKAIDAGVQYLRRNWNEKDHWESFLVASLTSMDGGITALATLALLNSGVKPTDEIVAKPLAYLRSMTPKKTYVVALANLCFAEVRDKGDLPRVQENTEWLLKTAVRRNGRLIGWSYPDGNIPRADASNTQYALLGLYAAKQCGVKVPEEDWKAILKLYTDTLIEETKDTGNWSYVEERRTASFTMTTAGVCGLLIARMGLEDSGQGLDPDTGKSARCGVYPENEAVRKGMNWIAGRFAFDRAEASTSTFYNVYGIERLGRLSGQRFIGKFDWYREGCEYLLRTQKKPDGFWSANEEGDFKGVNVISTSFALLFLSKGRSPVLISKMAHGPLKLDDSTKVYKEGNARGGAIDWNRKHNDARNLTDFAARELFKGLPLGWQSYDPRRGKEMTEADILAEAGVLVQSPILYLTGHEAPTLSGQHRKLFKKYLEEGGFVLAEACCGSKEFTDGFREMIAALFPGSELKPLAPSHAIWSSHFLVSPAEFPRLEGLEVGCRTVLVFSPEPLAGYWEETRFIPKPGQEPKTHGEKAFHLAANVIAYATGKEPPKQRLAQRKLVEAEQKSPPPGFVQPLQLDVGEPPPATAALRNLSGYLKETARLDVSLKSERMKPNNPDLFKYKFLYMHGKKGFEVDEKGVENIQATLQSGGLLLADACCGSKAFNDSFKVLAKKLFPDSELATIPPDDPLYSEKLNGRRIDMVELRAKAGDAKAGNDSGYERVPPQLQGIKLDGRWVIIFSEYDIGCALENHKSTDCLGHTPDSARKLAGAAVLYSLKR